MKLHSYWRSGAAYRVRLALALKGLTVQMVPVNLLNGAHRAPEYAKTNPQGLVPTLELHDGTTIGQSTAIIEYLEERYPEPPLLPPGAKARARVRHLCGIIAADIHPLQNLRVQKYLKDELDQPQTEVDAWLTRWIRDGFSAFERVLLQTPGRGAFCFGGKAGMAECFLLPQLYSARRFNVPVDDFPLLLGIEEATLALDTIKPALPEAQPDAA